MKRILLHVLFWTVYLVQDTILGYLWYAGKLSHIPVNEQVIMAIANCLVILIPKLLFTYFILYVVLNNIISGREKLMKSIVYIALSLIITLLLFRALIVYFIHPVVYHNLLVVPDFFSALGCLANLMDLGLPAGAAIFIKQIRLQLAGKEQEKILIKEKLETELRFLKNQTNPHFLFNTLNNIYALARKKSDTTADVVMKLSKILRFMLYESGRKFITIAEEIKLIEDYIDLEKIRYNERLNVSFNKDIDNISQEVSPLLLLPFVENAFKHGVSESFFESSVRIKLKLHQGRLLFEIENTKEDEEVQQNSNNKIGLCNIKRQLELMYSDHKLVVDNQAKRFKVSLDVNLNEHGEI